MQRLFEKHSVGLFFGILMIVIAGYIDMRTLVATMTQKVEEGLTLARDTSREQLLRTDEIDDMKSLRKFGAIQFHKNRQPKPRPFDDD